MSRCTPAILLLAAAAVFHTAAAVPAADPAAYVAKLDEFPPADAGVDLAGTRLPLTPRLQFVGGPAGPSPPGGGPLPAFWTVDGYGMPVEGADVPHDLDEAAALRIYNSMAYLQAMDTVFFEAQRQAKKIKEI